MARKAKPIPDTRATMHEPQPNAVPPGEVIYVRSHRVACDGVGGALGHPRVWLEMGGADFVECGYCDRRFVAVHDGHGHEDERLAPGVYEGPGGH